MKRVDVEEKKKYLSGYQESKRAVERLEEELKELGEAGRGIENKEMQQDIKKKIVNERYKRIRSFEEVRGKIEKMENETEKEALVYRHIRGLTEEKAARCMNYTTRQFQRIYRRAVEHFRM